MPPKASWTACAPGAVRCSAPTSPAALCCASSTHRSVALDHAVHARSGEGRSRVNRAPNRVFESIKTDYLRAQAQARSAGQPVQVTQAQLNDINARLSGLEQDQNRYADLTRAVQIQSDTYRALAIRDQEAQIEANRNAEKISAAVDDRGTLAGRTSRRGHARHWWRERACCWACCSAPGSCWRWRRLMTGLRTPREVAHVLRLPILATFGKDA